MEKDMINKFADMMKSMQWKKLKTLFDSNANISIYVTSEFNPIYTFNVCKFKVSELKKAIKERETPIEDDITVRIDGYEDIYGNYDQTEGEVLYFWVNDGKFTSYYFNQDGTLFPTETEE